MKTMMMSAAAVLFSAGLAAQDAATLLPANY